MCILLIKFNHNDGHDKSCENGHVIEFILFNYCVGFGKNSKLEWNFCQFFSISFFSRKYFRWKFHIRSSQQFIISSCCFGTWFVLNFRNGIIWVYTKMFEIDLEWNFFIASRSVWHNLCKQTEQKKKTNLVCRSVADTSK